MKKTIKQMNFPVTTIIRFVPSSLFRSGEGSRVRYFSILDAISYGYLRAPMHLSIIAAYVGASTNACMPLLYPRSVSLPNFQSVPSPPAERVRVRFEPWARRDGRKMGFVSSMARRAAAYFNN
jgi:hypothetical protein